YCLEKQPSNPCPLLDSISAIIGYIYLIKSYNMSQTNYSGTKCPKCEASTFELTHDVPHSSDGKQSTYRYYYLRCSKCKTFLSAFDFIAVGGVIEKIAEKLGITLR
ncbi:MAG: hypothetical protein Q8943_13670, partial [Bacteroidota bacterium]|nr:hypothetical protein [Bacteroidota bacterium]